MPSDAVISYLEAIPMPAILIGTDARIIGANARAVTLKPQAGDTRPFILVFRQPGLSSAIEACLVSRDKQSAIYYHDDGGYDTRYDVTCSFVENSDFEGALLCFQDVTQEEQVGQIRRDFVANVSHELRTPLTALMGFVETLRGPARDDAEARDRFLTIMESEAGRMNRLVGDLLSLSRVESEARMRPRTPVDINGLVFSAMRNLQPLAEESGVTLNSELPADPVMIPADADQMMQVFTNLIENAVKYGGEGGTVTARLVQVHRDSSLRAPAIRIEITDTGAGIDPVHIPRLTERFYRIDSHRSRAMGGTGLGLAIVKHIINRHRGRLKVDSELGCGSTFSVVLPMG
jgi:two-component system phosphate regulon sensor histidine kinase PhoR